MRLKIVIVLNLLTGIGPGPPPLGRRFDRDIPVNLRDKSDVGLFIVFYINAVLIGDSYNKNCVKKGQADDGVDNIYKKVVPLQEKVLMAFFQNFKFFFK